MNKEEILKLYMEICASTVSKMKNSLLISFIFLLSFSFQFLLVSCCADEQCGEEGEYGKNVVHLTDTIYQKTQKLNRGPMMVQIGAFANKSNADQFASDARSKLKTSVDIKLIKEGIYRVTIGEYNDLKTARETLSLAKKAGFLDSFIRDEYGEIER